jgi:hypothetical protein
VLRAASIVAALLLCGVGNIFAAQSQWVHLDDTGKLVYAHTPKGDRIVDFSYAGYRGGGVALPTFPVVRTLSPTGSDDTTAIQAAIDDVSKLPLVHGIRGAVMLSSGIFHCSGTLNIEASGVALRGSGWNEKAGTTIQMTDGPHLAVKIAGKLKQSLLGSPTTLTDAYVPSGTDIIHLVDASSLHVGDTLLLVKPTTPAWVKFMGMDRLERSDRQEYWVGEDLKVYRKVAAVDGNTVYLDVPLTDDIDIAFFGGIAPPVSHMEVSGQIAETGVEDLKIVAPSRSVNYGQDADFDGLSMVDAVDSWMHDVHLQDTTNSVSIGSGTERITVEEVDVQQQLAVTSSAKNFQFSCNGSQILFDRCSGRGDGLFYFATQARQQGPVVVLHCRFEGNGHIQPHQRWSTGLLVDSCDVPGGGIDLLNRGTMGSGHGWAIGWSLLWNNAAADFVVQQPPGAANWSIGDRGPHDTRPMPTSGGAKGPPLPMGIIESSGKPVQPVSLYLEQLRERLGPQALVAIGYGPGTTSKAR